MKEAAPDHGFLLFPFFFSPHEPNRTLYKNEYKKPEANEFLL